MDWAWPDVRLTANHHVIKPETRCIAPRDISEMGMVEMGEEMVMRMNAGTPFYLRWTFPPLPDDASAQICVTIEGDVKEGTTMASRLIGHLEPFPTVGLTRYYPSASRKRGEAYLPPALTQRRQGFSLSFGLILRVDEKKYRRVYIFRVKPIGRTGLSSVRSSRSSLTESSGTSGHRGPPTDTTLNLSEGIDPTESVPERERNGAADPENTKGRLGARKAVALAQTRVPSRGPLLRPTPGKDGAVFLDNGERHGDFARKLRGGLAETSSELEADSQQQSGSEDEESTQQTTSNSSEEEDESPEEEESEQAEDSTTHPDDEQQDRGSHEQKAGGARDAILEDVHGTKRTLNDGLREGHPKNAEILVDGDIDTARRLLHRDLSEGLKKYSRTLISGALRAKVSGAADCRQFNIEYVRPYNEMVKLVKRGMERASDGANGTEDDDTASMDQLELSPLVKRLKRNNPARAGQYERAKVALREHDIAGDVVGRLGVDGLQKAGISLGVAASIVDEVVRDHESRRTKSK